MLFLGNSYIGSGDVDQMVADLVGESGLTGLSADWQALIADGYTWADHERQAQTPGTAWEAALTGLSGTWDYVVLQEQSQIPGFPQDEPTWQASSDAGAALDAAVTALGAHTVLMQTWARRDGDAENPELYPDFASMQDRLTAGYAAYAADWSTPTRAVLVAPVGEAFRLVHDDLVARDEDPTALGSDFHALYAADGSHPSAAGSWLAACVLLETTTGTSCAGLTAPEPVPDALVPVLVDAADRAVGGGATTAFADTATPADPSSAAEAGAAAGCGCATGTGAPALATVLIPLLWRRRTVALALSVGACSDYEISPKPDADAPGLPDVRVIPVAVNAGILCDAVETTVTIENVGTAPLTVRSAAVAGDGWFITAAALPALLDPGSGMDLTLEGSAGEAELSILTDDPDTPILTVPLTATADRPPTLTFLDPVDGVVLPSDLPVTIVVDADDDATDPEALLVAVASDLAGDLGIAAPDPDGVARIPWDAPRLPTGIHRLTASTVDACGSPGAASIDVCQQGIIDVESLAIDTWHFEGVATWDALNGWLQLTHVANDLVGTAFNTGLLVSGDQVEIAFSFRIGGGSGADGISLTALDTTRQTTFLGGTGCGIGYGGDAPCTAGPALPGWSIEVDTWYNADADPTEADHLSFHFDGDVDNPAVWVALPEMEDTGWHAMVVSVTAPRVTMSIDGVVYIDQDLGGYFAFPAWVGFTAGTGGSTNEHLIDALTVTELLCEE